MNANARPWIGLVFKCCAALALIIAFVFFMRMQEDQSFIDRYRAEGTVSRAVVIGMERDTLATTTRKGRSRTTDIQVLTVRFNPKSGLKYADYTGQADIPSAPPATGNPMTDSEFSEVIWVSNAAFETTKVGDSFVVVDTPYSGDGPELIEGIRDFDPASYYPGIVMSLAAMLVFAVIGWRISRASALRGAAQVMPLPVPGASA
ncbi:hypothetical protein FHS52_001365 [Erythromicrobium ramosum]|uniref:DUF3592 domain-containing protein n=1 Tax=Erythrobacter ramosus TaxID=35811 RepID=A0A6I4UPV7_9SPHN|nr:hypothetical protein [Erythrobacter ramosus]MBB3775396.1 hypothetical protein [Erythrobacter ramosus]MXP39493.1 hypothetical protein [Erythrobacter ramosus]